jgi:response regulator RpfG family c-di-GMP phosphodiesterase
MENISVGVSPAKQTDQAVLFGANESQADYGWKTENNDANTSSAKETAPFILFVDDEPKALKGFENTFNDDFNILTASSALQALAILEVRGNDIAVVMSDQRMPEKSGVELLTYVNESQPDVVRILTSAYSDMAAAVDAVNVANVSQYITKPWDIKKLHKTLHDAVNQFLSSKSARTSEDSTTDITSAGANRAPARRTRGKPTNVDHYVGERVRTQRNILKLTQTELGDMLNVSFQQVQKYENGTNRISVGKLYQIAKALDVPLSFFFEGLPQNVKENVSYEHGYHKKVLDLARRFEALPKHYYGALDEVIKTFEAVPKKNH